MTSMKTSFFRCLIPSARQEHTPVACTVIFFSCSWSFRSMFLAPP